jgi:hypothetical protein
MACPGVRLGRVSARCALYKPKVWREALRRDLDGRLAILSVRWDTMDPGDDATVAEGRAKLGLLVFHNGYVSAEGNARAKDAFLELLRTKPFRQGTCDPSAADAHPRPGRPAGVGGWP